MVFFMILSINFIFAEPIIDSEVLDQIDNNGVSVEGVLLDEWIAKHEQALYELKQENALLKSELCKANPLYAFC